MITCYLNLIKLARLKNWRVFFIGGLIVLSHQSAAQVKFGQFSDDHLQPVANNYSAYRYQNEYDALIRRYLLDSLKDSPIARVVVRPSFSEEYVVSVDSSNGTCYLTYRRMNKSIWYKRQKDSLRAITTKIVIGRPLAQALNKLFFEACAQTRYPERRFFKGPNGEDFESLSIGTDGTTYVFMSFGYGHGVWSGQTWSPSKDTQMSALVDISNAMVKLAANSNQQQADELDLLNRSQALYKRIIESRLTK